MNKKLLATVLASTMVLGSVSAYAAVKDEATTVAPIKMTGLSDAGQKVTVKTSQAKLVIDVTIPTSMNMVLNPYNIDTVGQIVSPVIPIISASSSNIDLEVKVTAFDVAIAGSTTVKPTLLAAQPAANAPATTKKDIFLYLRSADAAVAVASPAVISDVVSTLTFANEQAFTEANDKLRVITKTGPLTTPLNLGTLEKGKAIGWKFDGSMNDKVLWDSKDTVSATPTFTFTPVPVPVTP